LAWVQFLIHDIPFVVDLYGSVLSEKTSVWII